MGIRAIAFVERFMVIFLWRIWLISVKRDELGWLIILTVISDKIMESFFLFPPLIEQLELSLFQENSSRFWNTCWLDEEKKRKKNSFLS